MFQPETKPWYENATDYFEKHLINNRFGYSCNVCDRLWFKQDLKQVTIYHLDILAREFVDEYVSQFKVCATCWLSLNKQRTTALSRSNGFVYPPYPTYFSPLDCITERLISPRLPFMQIRRLHIMSTA
jgi:hypothetical protein